MSLGRRGLLAAGLGAVGAVGLAGRAQAAAGYTATDRWFTTSDGVRLHYLDAAPNNPAGSRHVLVLVPGWTMPGWIFGPQIAAFAPFCRVIAFDPRGQGASDVPMSGYTAPRRGQDIAELIAQLRAPRVTLCGWSLGVLDSLAYVGAQGGGALNSLVLVDNSVGENPPPRAEPVPRHRRGQPKPNHAVFMRAFVRSMFHTPQSPAYLDRLTQASLVTPEWAARALLNYDVPRTYWRQSLYAAGVPVLYCVRPGLAGQADNVALHDPQAECVVFPTAGHALFVDQAARFNAVLAGFLRQRVWM